MELEGIKQKLDKLAKKVSEVKNRVSDRISFIDEQRPFAVTKPTERLHGLESQIIEKTMEVKDYQQKLKALEVDKKVLDMEIKKREAQIEEHKSTVARLEQEKQELVKEINELNKKLNEQIKKNSALEEQISALNKTLDEFKSQSIQYIKLEKEEKIANAKIIANEVATLMSSFKRWNRTNFGIIQQALELNKPNIIKSGFEKMQKALDAFTRVMEIPQTLASSFPLQTFIERFVLEMKLKYKNITITLDSNIPENLFITSDMSFLAEILEEVVKNSSESKEMVDVKISVEKNEVKSLIVVSIIDNGYGISPHLIDKVSSPFFTTKSDRFGLGLYRAKLLLSIIGGELKIESEYGKGTKVTIFFPI